MVRKIGQDLKRSLRFSQKNPRVSEAGAYNVKKKSFEDHVIFFL